MYKKLSIHKIRIEYESIFHNIIEGAEFVYDKNGVISEVYNDDTCIFEIYHKRKIIICFMLTEHCDSLEMHENDIKEIISHMFFKYYNIVDYAVF